MGGKGLSLRDYFQGDIIIYFPRNTKVWEIKPVILSSFGEGNELQVKRDELPREPCVNMGACSFMGDNLSLWGFVGHYFYAPHSSRY